MATFDPRVYHQMHAAAMHHQSVMNAGRYAAASSLPAQTPVHGGPSTALSPLGGGPAQGLHHNRAPAGIPGGPTGGDSSGSKSNPRASASTSLPGRGNPGSPFLRAGPGWPSTYRAAQNIPFPEAREACGARVAELVEDLAQGVGCPVEQILVPLLPCIGGLMGTNTSIRVHRAWSEPPVVWTMVGAAAGSRRSAVIRLLLAPILAIQAEKTAQQQSGTGRNPSQSQSENGLIAKSVNGAMVKANHDRSEGSGVNIGCSDRALYSGTRISLGALTEVLHRNAGHAFSLTENIEHLHEMLGLTQLPGAGSVGCPPSRLISVMEDLYEGLPLVAVEDGRVTTIQGSNFCHGGFSSPEYMVALMLKYPGWFSSRLLISCPQADNMKTGFGQTGNNLELPELEELFAIILNQHSHKNTKYNFSPQAVQELNVFFDEEWSTVFNQLDQNEHEGIIVKSMGQIVRMCGILKALENSILTAQAVKKGEDNEWDWNIGHDTVRNGVALGKYFLEQKLAMTFMVSTGFFNQSENSQSNSMSGKNGSGNSECDEIENMNNPTSLPHTATPENIEHINFPPSQASVDGDRPGAHNLPSSSNFPSYSMPPAGMHRSTNRNPEPNLSQMSYGSPMHPQEAPYGLPKQIGDVDFSTLPVTMTTAEEDVSEMMQAVDFVHFSKTQFVGVHGRRIKRLMECYDDGHGVSATTAAQKSITPPVHIEGTNNRHPAWASALFFQKVAELGLGSAEQNRHPTNKKVCWRFKRKPVNQLSDQDFKLLQYLRVEMDKYAQFGSGPINPSDMVNSGLLTVPPSTSPGPQPHQLAALTASSSNPLTENIDESSSESNSHSKDRFGVSVKSEIY